MGHGDQGAVSAGSATLGRRMALLGTAPPAPCLLPPESRAGQGGPIPLSEPRGCSGMRMSSAPAPWILRQPARLRPPPAAARPPSPPQHGAGGPRGGPEGVPSLRAATCAALKGKKSSASPGAAAPVCLSPSLLLFPFFFNRLPSPRPHRRQDGAASLPPTAAPCASPSPLLTSGVTMTAARVAGVPSPSPAPLPVPLPSPAPRRCRAPRAGRPRSLLP